MRVPSRVDAGADDRPGLYAALAALARRTSYGALTGAAAIGILTVLGLTLWWPGWWAFTMPLVALGAFGLWGIVERERVEHVERAPATAGTFVPRALAAVQWLAIALGTGAVLVAAVRGLGALIGTVIS